MGTHPLHDVALRIHDAFATEPRRSWLLGLLKECRQPTPPIEPDHCPVAFCIDPRLQPEPLEEDPDRFRSPILPTRIGREYTLAEIAFGLVAIHDAWQGNVDRFLPSDNELGKWFNQHFNLAVSACRNDRTIRDWGKVEIAAIETMLGKAVRIASEAANEHDKSRNEPPCISDGEEVAVEPQELPAEVAPSKNQDEAVELAPPLQVELQTSGYLGGTELCDSLGILPERRAAFNQKLHRERLRLGDCWIEASDRRPNQPQYLYRTDADELRKLAKGYQSPGSA